MMLEVVPASSRSGTREPLAAAPTARVKRSTSAASEAARRWPALQNADRPQPRRARRMSVTDHFGRQAGIHQRIVHFSLAGGAIGISGDFVSIPLPFGG